MRSTALVVIAAAALAGCATVTPYQALNDGQGYSEQKIEQNRWRVSFVGNDLTPRQTVENYLLYRAAELTLSQGYDYFVMSESSTDAQTRYTQTLNSFGGFGRYGWYPRSYLGAGVSTAIPSTEYEAQTFVLMRKGKKSERDTQAFDAREVQKNLESVIQRPQPRA